MAGAGYKLFNTGDVLTAAQVNTYLMEQTVMVFADAAARTTALTGVVSEGMLSYLKDTNAVEVYNGSAWVASDDPNAIQNTIVDAKGDLITATAADTPARLAVGNSGETLVADSSQSTGLRYNPPVGTLGNPVINGGMDIWQRGTSFSLAASTGYASGNVADRWQTLTGANQASTISRQATGDTTNLPNIQYAMRLQRNSGQTGTGSLVVASSFESVNSIPFAGKTVTMSFYARKGADFSPTSSVVTAYLFSGTGTDQNINAGPTGQATVVSSNVTLTTTWQRFVITGSVASTATQLFSYFLWTPTGTASTNDYWEVTGVQIDVGTWTASTAPTFRRSGGTIQGELAAASRYYQLIASGTSKILGVGYYVSATGIDGPIINLPVEMRTTPTISIVTGTNYYLSVSAGGGSDNLNSVTLASESTSRTAFFFNNSEAAGTAGQGCRIQTNNAAAFLALQAEL